MKSEIKLEKSWLKYLSEEFEKEYMIKIKKFLKKEIENGKIIYPKPSEIFNALNKTKLDNVNVVIIGQDPYHGPNQAHGLSFSVKDGIIPPPSLKNIYKEIESDTNSEKDFNNGNLINWANQGVLMLNSVLTVEKSKPASHSKIGWNKFTNKIIEVVSNQKKGVIFILWGAFAIKKKELINIEKHHIIESPHPSPFSAHKGFFGSKCFSKTNKILRDQGKKEIIW